MRKLVCCMSIFLLYSCGNADSAIVARKDYHSGEKVYKKDKGSYVLKKGLIFLDDKKNVRIYLQFDYFLDSFYAWFHGAHSRDAVFVYISASYIATDGKMSLLEPQMVFYWDDPMNPLVGILRATYFDLDSIEQCCTLKANFSGDFIYNIRKIFKNEEVTIISKFLKLDLVAKEDFYNSAILAYSIEEMVGERNDFYKSKVYFEKFISSWVL